MMGELGLQQVCGLSRRKLVETLRAVYVLSKLGACYKELGNAPLHQFQLR